MDQDCKKGVAIVEDDVELVKVYVKLFKRRGIPICFIAFNGMEAVHKFAELQNKPPVILMDNRMPLMGGVEATREILKIHPGSRVIFLSADVNAKEDAIKSGAMAFLQKPASINTVSHMICKALN